MTDYLRKILAHPLAERVVIALIILNAITLGLETSKSVTAAWGGVLHVLDTALLTFFVVELSARLWVKRLGFFKDGWNVFDFVVVGISLAPASESLSVLRSLRILRALRLITAVPSLKRVVSALISALPGMGSIVLLLALIFYVGAVMATKLFGDFDYGPDKGKFFGDLGASLVTLFQIMTLDAWATDVMRPLLKDHPLAWTFFVPFVLVTAFTALNLFIGVVVSALESEGQAAREKLEEGLAEGALQPIPMPVTNLDVLTELRALREQVASLQGQMSGQTGIQKH